MLFTDDAVNKIRALFRHVIQLRHSALQIPFPGEATGPNRNFWLQDIVEGTARVAIFGFQPHIDAVLLMRLQYIGENIAACIWKSKEQYHTGWYQ